MRLHRLYPVVCALLLAGCVILAATLEVTDPPRQAQARPAPQGGPKLALVLGSGGTRGFAHIGVIKVLEASGIEPDLVVGTSAGAIVGASSSSMRKPRAQTSSSIRPPAPAWA